MDVKLDSCLFIYPYGYFIPYIKNLLFNAGLCLFLVCVHMAVAVIFLVVQVKAKAMRGGGLKICVALVEVSAAAFIDSVMHPPPWERQQAQKTDSMN